jgi:hypothetical protein
MIIWRPTRLAAPVSRVRSILLTIFVLAFPVNNVTSAASSDSREAQVADLMSVSGGDVDVGITFPNATIDAVATLSNLSAKPVSVDRIVPRWAGTDADVGFVKATLAPSGTMDVSFKIRNRDNVGRFSHVFFVYSDGSSEPIGKIAIRGFTDWIIDPESVSVDVELLNYKESVERTFRPKSRPGETVLLTRISGRNKWFNAEIVQGGKELQIKSIKGMPWGKFDEQIVVDTDNMQQKKVTFHVKGEVRGAIVPNMATIDFGVIREGVPAEQTVRLEDESGKKVTIGKIEVTGALASASIVDCIPAAVSCKLLKLKLDQQSMGRAPRGVVSISFPEYGAKLPLVFGGALIGKDTVVRDLAKEVEASSHSSAGISSALRAATIASAPLEMPEPNGRGPLLKWEMANEARIFGYEIYRSDSEAGPFGRANNSILPRLSSDPAIPSIYRWRDSSAEPGKQYWYYIGVVYLNGKKETLNTPQMVIAK